ncbi:hypothetical protein BC629DRAFT_1436742 [Irpex lacteus]|nr:hypothetical protein BC629DRAFT_1436742 [Irpex lacteus]
MLCEPPKPYEVDTLSRMEINIHSVAFKLSIIYCKLAGLQHSIQVWNLRPTVSARIQHLTAGGSLNWTGYQLFQYGHWQRIFTLDCIAPIQGTYGHCIGNVLSGNYFGSTITVHLQSATDSVINEYIIYLRHVLPNCDAHLHKLKPEDCRSSNQIISNDSLSRPPPPSNNLTSFTAARTRKESYQHPVFVWRKNVDNLKRAVVALLLAGSFFSIEGASTTALILRKVRYYPYTVALLWHDQSNNIASSLSFFALGVMVTKCVKAACISYTIFGHESQ